LTNVYPQTQPVVVTVNPTAPGAINVTNVTAGAVNARPVAYHHVQNVASNVWLINHKLMFYPNLTTLDSAGSVCEGEIEHMSKDQVKITFSAAFSGQAYLS
jgi:hypothetical protein